VIAAATLRAVLDPPTAAHGPLVEFLEEQAARLSRRRDASADTLLNRLLARVEPGGGRWGSVKKDDAAQLLETDATGLDKILRSGVGLSWSQFRRAAVMREAVASLAHGDDYVSQIAYRLGYDHAGVFDRDFHLFLGVTPTKYRRLTRIRP
jgi:AraC-like DNA-binding protein